MEQSIITLEEFTPFNTPPMLKNPSLSNFKETSSIITINSHGIKSVSAAETNSNKLGMAFQIIIDALIGFIKNFCFASSFLLKRLHFYIWDRSKE